MTEIPEKRHLTGAGLWRWRHSPLRRRSDLVEAWVLLVAWVLVVVGGALAGLVTARAADRTFDRQRVERREVVATVVKDAKTSEVSEASKASTGSEGNVATAREGDGERAWATVRWTTPEGALRKGRTQVAPHTRAGARVTVWIDRHGALATKPLGPTEASLEAALLGTMATAVTSGMVWVCACGVRGCLERRRMAQWDEEWQRIDTRWGGKTG